MRVLVSTTAGEGHFGPLVPFARACERGGHEVLVAAPASFAAAVERVGLPHAPFADASRAELGAVFASLEGLPHDEASARVVREVFARIDASAALPGLREVVDTWRPDVVLRETGELASYVAAEHRGIPHAQVAVSLTRMEEVFAGLVEQPLTALRASVGLPADDGLARLRAAPRFTLFPASIDPTGSVFSETRRFRERASHVGDTALPEWWPNSGDPLVYVTFGSVAASMERLSGLYPAVVAALADLPARVLVTVGNAGDPHIIPLPANVHVERWWPQAEIMPHAAAMVGHGGSGTTLAGLAAGLPMVVLPLFADQPGNAAQVQAVGAGVALEGGLEAVGQLAEAVQRVLDEPSYRVAAGRIADEIRALPDVAEAVPLLEEFALTGPTRPAPA